MKKGLVLTSLLLSAGPATASDLIITGIMDGPLSGGTPKAIELYARNPIADLSIYGFGSANNGGGSDGEEFALPEGEAAAGDFLYIASEAANFSTVFGFAPTFTTTSANVNGDDAVELFRNGVVVDVFGEIDVDGNSQPWEYLDSWAYRQTGPAGGAFAIDQWGFGGVNALSGLDAAATAAAVPFGTFAVAPVPVPGALWLLGSAVLGLVALRRRA